MQAAAIADATHLDWIAVGEQKSRQGVTAMPWVDYRPARSALTGQVLVQVEYRLAGFWVRRTDADIIDLVDLPDGRVLDPPGTPRVPALVFSVALPYGASLETGNVQTDSVEQPWNLGHPLQLRAVPRPRIEADKLYEDPDPAAFDRSGWFPAAAVTVREASDVDGMSRFAMRVNPLAYEAISGRLLVRERIRLALMCSVEEDGRYDEEAIDVFSPVLQGVLGSHQLLR